LSSKKPLTTTEENYLKVIFKLAAKFPEGSFIHTNDIAHSIDTKAASVTDMIKKLDVKKFLDYTPYRGVVLTKSGNKVATKLVRRHRLWEVFLLEKLKFKWDEVHDMAEQLEHIQSDELTDRLDAFLDHPRFDPHGDPIPDKDGNIIEQVQQNLSDLVVGEKAIVVGVNQDSNEFLKYLDSVGLTLKTTIEVLAKHDYDESVDLLVNKKNKQTISKKVSNNLLVVKD